MDFAGGFILWIWLEFWENEGFSVTMILGAWPAPWVCLSSGKRGLFRYNDFGRLAGPIGLVYSFYGFHFGCWKVVVSYGVDFSCF